MVNETPSGSDYKPEEDPTVFHSSKTGRGPLTPNWIDDCLRAKTPLMCAYKLCRVEFKYWGIQGRVEQFIHDVGLRKTMLRAHRQAWAWQDEWCGLTIDDIRRLERQAQLALNKKVLVVPFWSFVRMDV